MFETSRRTHPLHTFRFWFVVVAAAVVTLAWRFDLLPFRVGPAETGELAQTFVELEPIGEETPPQQSEPSARLPFDQAEETLNVPALAPSAHPLRTAAVEPTEVASLEAESRESMPTTTAARPSAPFELFGDDDWPTPEQSRPGSNVVLANATSISPETEGGEGLTRAAGTADRNPPGSGGSSTLPAGPAGATADVDLAEIDRLIATGVAADEVEAHRLLSTLYWQRPAARPALRQRIDVLAQNIYFLNSRHYMDAYLVQPGDMLQSIARQYNVPWEYLARLNRVDPKRVRAGQRLKVIKGPFSAIVDLSDYELTIHAHGYYVTRFPVGIGKDGSSPIGQFTVQEKLIDPTYYGPDGIIEHDDPANPLGERWIDIGNSYGLHGTIDSASIGKSESRGCIRLQNEDVAAVYDLLTIGSEVTIRP